MTDQPASAPAAIEKAGGQAGLLTEVGRGGLRHWGGYVYDDEDTRLHGLQAVRQYRRMTKDPTVAAMLFALTTLLRSVNWRVEATDDTQEHKDARDFAEGVLFQDMEHTWNDFIADAASMLPYGFAPFEMVYKKRSGTAKGTDPIKGSIFTDGRIGLKKIALRRQDTIQRWWFDDDTDDLLGVYQLDLMRGREIQIPMERLILLRTTPNSGNPEGKSILEAAVRPYEQLRVFEHAEASIAVRASGIVTLGIPVDAYSDPAKLAVWEALARSISEDRAGYIVLPTIIDKEGRKVDAYTVGYTVADGRRTGDFTPIIGRKKQEIAAVALADFILLGHNNKGALSLSVDKTDLFKEAGTAILGSIRDAVNRIVLPRIWAVNGLPREVMPEAKHDDLSKENLQVLSAFLGAMTAAGMQMDDTLEDALRTKANLPLKPRTAETEPTDQQPGPPAGKPPPVKPGGAGGDDEGDGLANAAPEAAQQASGTKPPAKRSSKPGQVAKAAREDIEALGRVLPDDPAYREALAVLAGGPIPVGVDLEGGAPAAGPVPFHQAMTKHNPYHDARGRFTFGPENDGGNGNSVKDFLESDASGLVVVAKVPADIQAHLGAKTTRIFLSSDTRDSHKKHNWTSEDFALLQDLLDHGEVRTDRDNHVVVAHINGVWRYAAVKVTGDQKEVYLSSFHRMRAKQVYDFPNRGRLIRAARKV